MSSQLDSRIQSVPTLWLGFLKELHCSLLVISLLWWGGEGRERGAQGGGKGNKIKNKKSPLKN
jgi:hypothetical protein